MGGNHNSHAYGQVRTRGKTNQDGGNRASKWVSNGNFLTANLTGITRIDLSTYSDAPQVLPSGRRGHKGKAKKAAPAVTEQSIIRVRSACRARLRAFARLQLQPLPRSRTHTHTHTHSRARAPQSLLGL